MILALLALAAATPANDLAAPLPPPLPWTGASERLVAAPGDPWITPAEAQRLRRDPVL